MNQAAQSRRLFLCVVWPCSLVARIVREDWVRLAEAPDYGRGVVGCFPLVQLLRWFNEPDQIGLAAACLAQGLPDGRPVGVSSRRSARRCVVSREALLVLKAQRLGRLRTASVVAARSV